MYLSLGHLGIFTLFVLCLYWNKLYITWPLYLLLRRRVLLQPPHPPGFVAMRRFSGVSRFWKWLGFELLRALPALSSVVPYNVNLNLGFLTPLTVNPCLLWNSATWLPSHCHDRTALRFTAQPEWNGFCWVARGLSLRVERPSCVQSVSLSTWGPSLADPVLEVLSLAEETKAFTALYSCVCVGKRKRRV